ncbi:MAG TPA: cytochrome C oxidase subunit IV family protein [Polyangiaceae bacterium]|jgi:caa(3)-type oxidase subunit IV
MSHVHINRKQYWQIFVALFVLTILEIAVVLVPGIAKALVIIALVGLAIVKATLVGLFYMHLIHEKRVLKLTVGIPMAMPGVYALVLVTEAAWRLVR